MQQVDNRRAGKVIITISVAATCAVLAMREFTLPEGGIDAVVLAAAGTVALLCAVTQDSHEPSNGSVAALRSSPDLRSLLEHVLDELQAATLTDYNQIMFRDYLDAARLVVVADAIAHGKQRYRIAPIDGLFGRVMKTGCTANVGDTSVHSDYTMAVPQTRSQLVVPIYDAGELIGLVNSEAESAHYFSPKTASSVEDLATALGPAARALGWTPWRRADELPHLDLWRRRDADADWRHGGRTVPPIR